MRGRIQRTGKAVRPVGRYPAASCPIKRNRLLENFVCNCIHSVYYICISNSERLLEKKIYDLVGLIRRANFLVWNFHSEISFQRFPCSDRTASGSTVLRKRGSLCVRSRSGPHDGHTAKTYKITLIILTLSILRASTLFTKTVITVFSLGVLP